MINGPATSNDKLKLKFTPLEQQTEKNRTSTMDREKNVLSKSNNQLDSDL